MTPNVVASMKRSHSRSRLVRQTRRRKVVLRSAAAQEIVPKTGMSVARFAPTSCQIDAKSTQMAAQKNV